MLVVMYDARKEVQGEFYRLGKCIEGLFIDSALRQDACKHLAMALEILKDAPTTGDPNYQPPARTPWDGKPTTDRVLE